jgi:hypothetical protein
LQREGSTPSATTDNQRRDGRVETLAGGSSCYIHLVVVVLSSIEMRLLILVAASALGVAAVWAVNFRARRKRLGHHFLPRFFLLIALYERLPELTSIYLDEAEWESFSLEILKCLGEIRCWRDES